MLVTLKRDSDAAEITARLQGLGLWAERLEGPAGSPIAVLVGAHSARVDLDEIARIEGVEAVCRRPSAHPRVDALAGSTLAIGPARLGGEEPPVLMAGPCSVESRDLAFAAAALVREAGGRLLRGGAYKPRTSPYAFQGLGRPALGWLRDAADAEGLGVVTEVMSELEVGAVGEVADLVQVGSRNMQNFALLRAVGALAKPVLLKRGMSATIEEWLLAGEHLLAAGATGVVFCERGILGFDPSTRNLLDLAAVAVLAHVHRVPVVVDPSHATGRRDLVPPLARAAVAAGAHGLLVESHPDPSRAKSDGPQALDGATLVALGRSLSR